MQEPSVLDYLRSLLRGKPLKIPGEAPPSNLDENGPIQQVPSEQDEVFDRIDDSTDRVVGEAAPAFSEAPPPEFQPGAAIPYLPRVEKPPTMVTWVKAGWEMVRDGLNYFRVKRGRMIGLGLVIALTLYILSALPNLTRSDSHLGVFVAWVAAIGIYFWIFRSDRSSTGRTSLYADFQENRLAYLILGGILLGGFFLRIWHVGSIPFTLSGDEASFGAESLKVISGEIQDPFITGHLSQPTMSFYPGALTQKLFGVSAFAIRLPWVIVGTLSILAAYLLTARLFGRPVGLAVAAAVAMYHFHIHYSRLNLNNIADPFFVSMSLYWLYRAVETRSKTDWAWVGTFAGLALYFYTGARLVLVVVGSVLLYWLVYEHHKVTRQTLAGVLIGMGALLVVGAPMLQFANQHPDEFNGRVNQVGILQSGWLVREVEITGQTMQTILVDQFRRAALAFNYYPDRSSFYDLREPLLDPWFGTLLLFALGFGTLIMLLPGGDKRWFPVAAWFWGGIILGGMMTITPPASQRIITVSIPACILLVLGVYELGGMAKKAFGKFPVHALLVVAVALFGVMSLQTYFARYTPRQLYGGTHAELATTLAPMLNDLKDTHRIVFLGAPFVYWGFPTFPYLVQGADAQDILDPLTAPPPLEVLPPGKGGVFIFLPAREQELTYVQQAFPGGETRLVETDSELQTRALVYIVAPGGK